MCNGFNVFLEALAHIVLYWYYFTKVLVLSMPSCHRDASLPKISQLSVFFLYKSSFLLLWKHNG